MATNSEVVFTRDRSIAEVLEELIDSAKQSVEAALYRFNSRRLAEALQEANDRGLKVRLVLDHNKYEESQATRQLLSNGSLPFRVTYGKDGPGSKMHHKFVLVDGRSVVTGSYNWTLGSEEKNYENVLILHDPKQLRVYQEEFEALWARAEEIAHE